MTKSKKVEFIKALFELHQPKLNVVEQIAILTVWIEACIEREEYEMAGALTKIMNNIQENPSSVPQRLEGDLNLDPQLETDPLHHFSGDEHNTDDLDKNNKPSIYKRIINWFKKVFNSRFNKRI